jgi:SulP family sulfate permease
VAHVITVERRVTPAAVADARGSDVSDAGGAGAVAGSAPAPETVRYDVVGPLFFGSSNDLVEHFSYGDDPATVVVDLSRAQVWDASSVAALDSVDEKFRAHGVSATFVGLDDRSQAFHGRLTGRLG